MDKHNTNKEDLLNLANHGPIWSAQKIKDDLGSLLEKNSSRFYHDFRYDFDGKYHFIYDNECYLFIFDGRIETRSDKDNVFSTDKTFIHEIKDAKGIFTAYEHFISLIMEDEED
jgi:hypothetical protein